MNRPEFDDHINMYGGDLSKWPADLQQQAYFYLQNNPQDFEELEFFKDIERELNTREKIRSSRSLVDDIMMDLPDHEEIDNSSPYQAGLMKKTMMLLSDLSMGRIPAYALAISLVCGIILGTWSSINDHNTVGDLASLNDATYSVFYFY